MKRTELRATALSRRSAGPTALRSQRAAGWAGTLAFAMTLGWGAAASAQTYATLRQPVPGGYQRLTDAAVLIQAPANSTVRQASLPFQFQYYGRSFETVTVGVNGAVIMGNALAISDVNPLPGSMSPHNFIAPFWDDLHLQVGQPGRVLFQVEGEAPSRIATIEWRDLNRIPEAARPELNFQLRLHEGPSGRIDVNYGPSGASPVALDGTMAMENSFGEGIVSFDAASTCTNRCTAAALMAVQGTQTVVLQAGLDLAALQVAAPALGFRDTPLQLDVRLRSLHSATLTVDWKIVFSEFPDLRDPTVVLDRRAQAVTRQQIIPAIGDAPISVMAAVPPGAYYVGLIIDENDAVAESDETNNVLVSDRRVRIVDGNPDLVARTVAAPADAESGAQIDVPVTIENIGSSAANNAQVSIVLSTNPAISRRDLAVGEFTVTVPAGMSDTRTVSVTIPADTGSGNYWIGVVADPSEQITENNETNNAVAASGPITIDGGALAIVTMALPRAEQFSVYSAQLRAVGGDGRYEWRVTSGELPAGLVLSTSGLISGMTAEVGTAGVQFNVASGGDNDRARLDLEVVDSDEPLTVVTNRAKSGVQDQEYVFQLQSTGGTATASATWTYTGGLPEGLTLSDAGIVAGTPTEVGSSTIAVSVRNGAEQAMGQVQLSIAPHANLQIDASDLPLATYASAYEVSLSATGGLPPLAWVQKSGILPTGVTLAENGTLSGVPLQVGRFRFVIEARDSELGALAARDSNAFELVVQDVDGFEIVTPALETAFVDDNYDATITAEGGTLPLTWTILQGTVPADLQVDASPQTGVLRIFGTPIEAKSTNLFVEVIDAHGRRATKAFVIRAIVRVSGEGGGCSSADASQHRLPVTTLLVLFGLLIRRRGGRLR